MAVVDELVTVLGIKLAGDALAKMKSFKDGIGEIASSVTSFALVVAGTATAAGYFIKSVAEGAAELETLSQKTGLSTTELQEWSFAAQQAGVDSNAFANDLQGLRDKFGGTGKQAEAMLLRMADSFSKMSAAQARNIGKAWGLSEDTILLLRRGRDGLEELKKQAHDLGGIIPEDAIKRASVFQKKVQELSFMMRGLASQVAIATVPALSQLIDIFKEFIIRNREWISLGLESIMGGLVKGFDRFIGVLKRVSGVFDPIIGAIKSFLPEMSGVEFVTHLVTGALTALAIVFAPLIAKFILIGAAIGAVSMLFEDLFTFIEGGDSVIGHFFDEFKKEFPDLFALLEKLYNWFNANIGPAMEALAKGAQYLGSKIAEVGKYFLSMVNDLAGPVMDFFDTFNEKFPTLAKVLGNFGDMIKDVFKAGVDVATAALKGLIDLIGTVLGWIGKGIKALSGFLDMIFESEEKARTVTKQEADATWDSVSNLTSQKALPTSQAPSQAASSSSSTTENNDNRTINLTLTSPDAAQAAKVVMDTIDNSSVNVNTPGDFAARAM